MSTHHPLQKNGPAATFVTWNVGLLRGFVPYAGARREAVAEAVACLAADIVCLQEVWLFEDATGRWVADDIELVVDTARARFAHHHVVITEAGDASTCCEPGELDELLACIEKNCADASAESLAELAAQHCHQQFLALSSGCQACIAANLGKPIEQIAAICKDKSSGFTAHGHNGVLLLSRTPFSALGHLELPGALVKRVVLHARVVLEALGEVDVFATHLAADLSYKIAYPGGEFASFEQEHAAQVEHLLAYIDQRVGSGFAVIMGDLNCGPSKGDIVGELESNYNRLVEAGFFNPYVDPQASPRATYSSENTLNKPGKAEKVIDHVLIRGPRAVEVLEAVRIMDETAPIVVEGEQQALHLSDHYGLRVVVK